MICFACDSAIDAYEQFLHCTSKACDNYCHISCIHNENIHDVDLNSWICRECYVSAENNNSNRESFGNPFECDDANVTLRRKYTSTPKIEEIQSSNSSELNSEIRLLRHEVLTLSDQLCQAMSIITCYHDKLDVYSNQMATMDAKLKKFEEERLQSNVQEHVVDQRKSPADIPRQAAGPSGHKKRKRQNKSNKPQQQFPSITPLPPVTSTNPIFVDKQLTINHSKQQQQQVNDEQAPLGNVEAGPSSSSTNRESQQLQSKNNTRLSSSETNNGHKSLSGKAGPNVTTLKAAETRKFIHVWNMESDVEEVRDYLRRLCPTATCTVDELTPKGHYKSYKIGIPVPFFEKIFSVDVWPVNAQIKLWFPFIRRYFKKRELTPTQHTFRGSSRPQ